MLEQPSPWLKLLRTGLAVDVEYEDLRLWYAAFFRCYQHRIQQLQFGDQDLRLRSLDVVHQLSRGVRRVCPGKNATSTNSAQDEQRIVDL